jgi:hypothetical protein
MTKCQKRAVISQCGQQLQNDIEAGLKMVWTVSYEEWKEIFPDLYPYVCDCNQLATGEIYSGFEVGK